MLGRQSRPACSLSRLLLHGLAQGTGESTSLLANTTRQFSSAVAAGRSSLCGPVLQNYKSSGYESVFPAAALPHLRSFSFSPWGGSKKEEDSPKDNTSPATDTASSAEAGPWSEPFDSTASSSSDSFDAAAADARQCAADTAAEASSTAATAFDPSIIAQAATAGEADAIAASIADSNFLSAGIQQLLTAAHLSTGTDWWQSIVLATFFVRLVTCPMAIMAVKNTYRMSAARPEMEQLAEWFKKESMSEGNVPRAREEYQQRMAGIWSKYNCNPLKSLASIAVQAPVFIGFFSALRAMAAHKVPSMTEGGMLWFSDLTLADPYYALPIISSLVFLTTIELGAADGMQGQDPKVMTRMKNFMRALAVIMVPLTASMPQSVFCYWITSNAFSLLQSIVLKVPAVKQALGLPDLTRAAASTGGAGPHIPVVTFSAPPRPQAKVQPKKIVTVFPEPVPRTGAKKKQKQ